MFSFDRSLSDWPSVIEKNYLSFFNKKRKQRKNKRNTNQIPLKTFGFESTFEFGYGKGGLEISAIISFLIS